MGRPTKFDPEIANMILMAVGAGNYIETAAAYAGIARSTLFLWLKQGRREWMKYQEGEVKKPSALAIFSDSMKKEIAKAEMRDFAIIGRAAESQWTAAAWRLERRFPEKYGRRLQMDASVSDLTVKAGMKKVGEHRTHILKLLKTAHPELFGPNGKPKLLASSN